MSQHDGTGPKDDQRACQAETVVDLLACLSRSTHLELLAALAVMERDVTNMAEALELDASNVSTHLKPLRELGIIEMKRIQKRHVYMLADSITVEVRGETVTLHIRALDGHTVAVQTHLPPGARK